MTEPAGLPSGHPRHRFHGENTIAGSCGMMRETGMTEQEVAGVERTLGTILARLEDIARRLDGADGARKEMYEKFDRHNADVADLRHHTDKRFDEVNNRLTRVEDQVGSVVVVAEQFKTYETKGKTYVEMGSAIGSKVWKVLGVIGVLVAAFWREILAVIRGG